jgi:hypothetical protein
MRSRHSKLSYGFLAAGFALSLASIGCGDDDAGTGGSGGASGAKAGTGGASGAKAGTGGASGAKAGTGGAGGGGAVTPTMCISDTKAATAGAIADACITCACNADATMIEACTKTAMCWQLIGCVRTMCAGITDMAMRTTCATSKCASFLAGATPATPAGAILTGSACMSMCSSGDAGVDAGN